MKYADLGVALPEHVLCLVRRDEGLSQLHRILVTEICIENGDFDFANLDNPAQARSFHQEELSEKAKNAYLAIRSELSALYGILIPDINQ